MGEAGRVALLMVVGFVAIPAFAAQDIIVPRIDGRVFADSRPVDWLIEVRLDSQDASTVATAYTLGSSEFEFENLTLQSGFSYFLVIEEPGFEVVRHELRPDSFRSDSSRGISRFSGLVSLELVRLPEDAADDSVLQGPRAIDVRELLAEIPDEARDALDQGLAAREAGDHDAAIVDLERAVELAPDFSDALNALGAEYIRVGLFSEAEGVLDRARSLNPNDPVPLTNLGTLHYQTGERLEAGLDTPGSRDAAQVVFAEAVEVLEAAMRLDPRSPRTAFYLGSALYKVGSYDRAEAVLLTALAEDPSMSEVHLTLVNVYTRQQRYVPALDQIELFLEAQPGASQRAQLEALRIQIDSVLGGR